MILTEPIEISLLFISIAFLFFVVLAIAELAAQYMAYLAESKRFRDIIRKLMSNRL